MDSIDSVIRSWQAERPDLDFSPVGVVGRIQRLSRLFDREIQVFSAAHGLEQWEVDVLFTLRRAGDPYELTAGALVKSALVTSGAVTNRVDRMSAKNLVRRVADPTDRRAVRIGLTAHGRRIADDLIAEHLANEARLLQVLSTRQFDTLTKALGGLLEAVEATTSKR